MWYVPHTLFMLPFRGTNRCSQLDHLPKLPALRELTIRHGPVWSMTTEQAIDEVNKAIEFNKSWWPKKGIAALEKSDVEPKKRVLTLEYFVRDHDRGPQWYGLPMRVERRFVVKV